MTGAAIDCRVNPWCYAAIDKNLHRHSRRQPRPVWIGPKAQEGPASFPRPRGRRPGLAFSPRGEGTVRAAINRVAYAEFIRLTCIRAGVEPWTPHQLRHTRATQVAHLYESDAAAAAVIGDTEHVARTIYVDPNEAVARRIAKATG